MRYHQRRAWALLVCDASPMIDIVSSLLLERLPQPLQAKTYFVVFIELDGSNLMNVKHSFVDSYLNSTTGWLPRHFFAKFFSSVSVVRLYLYLRCSRPWELLGAILCILLVHGRQCWIATVFIWYLHQKCGRFKKVSIIHKGMFCHLNWEIIMDESQVEQISAQIFTGFLWCTDNSIEDKMWAQRRVSWQLIATFLEWFTYTPLKIHVPI